VHPSAAFDAGHRLALSWVGELTREPRPASAVRRDAWAKLRRVLAAGALDLVPEVHSLPPKARERALEAGFLAGLHASLYVASDGALVMTEALATEVGYTVAYLGMLTAPSSRALTPGRLACKTLQAVCAFVVRGDHHNPMIESIRSQGLWAAFYRGVAQGLANAEDDLLDAPSRRRPHLRLVVSRS